MFNKKNKIKGSAVLVVVLSAMVFSIYTMSTFSESEHFGLIVDRYEKNTKLYYEKYIDNVDSFYNKILLENNK